MEKSKKILITSPYSTNGGVSSFVNSLYPFFNSKIKIFFRGDNPNLRHKIFKTFMILMLPFRYFISLLIYRPTCVFINTSLSKTCLLRDGLLVIISKLLRKKVVLMVHGFEESSLKYKFLLKTS